PDPEALIVVAGYTSVRSLKPLDLSDSLIVDVEAGDEVYNIAADQSITTKRFIHSDWAGPITLGSDYHLWLNLKLVFKAPLRTTSLEATETLNGYFLDYLGIPFIHIHMISIIFALDIAAKTAALPGTGKEPVSFIYSFDLTHVVARMFDQSTGAGDESTYFLGDKLTCNEFLARMKETRGTKIDVAHRACEPSPAYSFFPKMRLQWLYANIAHDGAGIARPTVREGRR
ncbi:NmrA-like family protein, partial [Colletotrichum incanum]